MSSIPLNVKVYLINNYIQSNYLKSRGKAEHDDWPISKILESIIEDLKALEKEKSNAKEELPIGLVVRDLKSLSAKQASMKKALESVVEEISQLLETESEELVSFEKIIKKIEEFDKK